MKIPRPKARFITTVTLILWATVITIPSWPLVRTVVLWDIMILWAMVITIPTWLFVRTVIIVPTLMTTGTKIIIINFQITYRPRTRTVATMLIVWPITFDWTSIAIILGKISSDWIVSLLILHNT